MHDPGVDDQDAVDERGPGFGQADHDRAAVILCPAASQQTVHDAAMVAGYARVFDDLRTPVVVCADNRMRSRGPRLKG